MFYKVIQCQTLTDSPDKNHNTSKGDEEIDRCEKPHWLSSGSKHTQETEQQI